MKPKLILDNHFRKRDELFRPETFDCLTNLCDVVGGRDAPMDRDEILAQLPEASFYVAARPELTSAELEAAPHLKATIEVAGAFRDHLDYEACFDRGVEVLSCSPGFRNAVAEMTMSMMLAGGRGLVAEHEAFRSGKERWLDDRDDSDFSLYGQTVGFIGFGQIARETCRLIAPFAPKILAYDPFVGAAAEAELVDLNTLVSKSRIVVVAAVPSEQNKGVLSADLISKLQRGALVIVISRAWCVDFLALTKAANKGRIQMATDVFPDEPLNKSDPLRQARNVILSPHRAAAVPGGRQLIGDMILHDVNAILNGTPERELKPADPAMVQDLVNAQNKLKPVPNT